MPAVIVKHTVADFDAWLPHFENHADARKAAGVTKAVVWREAGDPNTVLVLFKVEDLDRAREFTSDPALAKVMQEAGVTGPPTFHFLEDGRKYEN